MVGSQVIFVLFASLFLAQANSAVFERSENSGWHSSVVHQFSLIVTKESMTQQRTGFNGGWGEFELAVLNITNSVNVVHICLIFLVDNKFTVLFASNSGICQVAALSDGVSSDSKQDGVVFISLLSTLSVPGDLNATIRVWPFKLGGCCFSDELRATDILHVLCNFICHLLIKASEENRSDHNSGVISISGQEASTFESDVRRTNNESLTRGLLQ